MTRQTALLAVLIVSVGALTPARGGAQSARVSGTVRDTAGHAIPGVVVSVVGTSTTAVTGPAGSFQLAGVAAGAQVIHLQRLGYRPAEVPVQLDPTKEVVIEPTLIAVAVELKTVEVGAPAPTRNLGVQGFEERRKAGRGQFVTAEEFKEFSPRDVESVLRRMHSLRVAVTKDGPIVISTRGLVARSTPQGAQPAMCAMQLGLNGKVMDNLQIDDVGIDEVAAIEVYAGPGTMPAEFNTTQSSGSSGFGRGFSSSSNSYCGLVMIWTKH